MMNAPEITVVPWRLVVIAILILVFRRIPIMLALKPIIPDIRTWREALFCGHFGPIGVGAIFISILARAELETGHTVPLATLPTDPNSPNYTVILAIWPIVSFLILSSVCFRQKYANVDYCSWIIDSRVHTGKTSQHLVVHNHLHARQWHNASLGP
jgi:NhaP-type Na+/H+ or K+/H+ antiporter